MEKIIVHTGTVPITVITDDGLAEQWAETWTDILTGESATITRIIYLEN